MKLVYGLMALVLFQTTAQAQEQKKSKKEHSISISSDGIKVDKSTDSAKPEKVFSFEFGVVDIGINSVQDKTDYTGAAVQQYLDVPQNISNSSLFSLRNGKSWNVNIWPVMAKLRLLKTDHQKIYLYSGIGLQVYNFRYTKDISYNDSTRGVYLDNVQFAKNKLCVTYASIPLGLTFKTKLAEKAWLVYGFGVTGGYRISSYMKQVSGTRGKQRVRDSDNFADFNTCVTGEIGLDNYFRLFASYQLTPMHDAVIDQHPFTIGLRLGGI